MDTALNCTSTREVEVSFIVPSRLHQMCLPPQSSRLPAVAFASPVIHFSWQTRTINIEHRLNHPFASLARYSRFRRASFFTYIQRHRSTTISKQVIRHALSGLGRHPLPQGLPGAVQGVQDNMLCRTGWQWRRVHRRQRYVHAF